MYGKCFRFLVTVVFILSGFSTNAYAFFSAPFGWYLEANAGNSKILDQNNVGSSSNNSGVGLSIDLGYKFMPYFGGEIGYTRYADRNFKGPTGNTDATGKYYSYDIAAKGMLPVYDSGVEIFAKLGVQRQHSRITVSNPTPGFTNSSASHTGIYLGAGGQYYFMPEFAIVAQWARAQGNNAAGTMDLYSIGVSYLFDWF